MSTGDHPNLEVKELEQRYQRAIAEISEEGDDDPPSDLAVASLVEGGIAAEDGSFTPVIPRGALEF